MCVKNHKMIGQQRYKARQRCIRARQLLRPLLARNEQKNFIVAALDNGHKQTSFDTFSSSFLKEVAKPFSFCTLCKIRASWWC